MHRAPSPFEVQLNVYMQEKFGSQLQFQLFHHLISTSPQISPLQLSPFNHRPSLNDQQQPTNKSKRSLHLRLCHIQTLRQLNLVRFQLKLQISDCQKGQSIKLNTSKFWKLTLLASVKINGA